LENNKSYQVETTKLDQYINRPIDFLKIDIEGAEYNVLKSIKSKLGNVRNLFIEYHSFSDKEQVLNEILSILTECKFRYYIEHVGVRSHHPFIKISSFQNMDIQLNIFAYKH